LKNLKADSLVKIKAGIIWNRLHTDNILGQIYEKNFESEQYKPLEDLNLYSANLATALNMSLSGTVSFLKSNAYARFINTFIHDKHKIQLQALF
jgi:hypothetical protein